MAPSVRPVGMSPPLDPKIIGPVDELAAKHFHGVSLVPQMLAAATDGVSRRLDWGTASEHGRITSHKILHSTSGYGNNTLIAVEINGGGTARLFSPWQGALIP
jgi:hypothetical protein